MKKHDLVKLGIGCLALQLVVAGQNLRAADAPKTDNEKIGYALGMNFASNVKRLQEQLKAGGIDLDVNSFLNGVKDVVSGGTPALSVSDAKTILTPVQEKVMAAQQKLQVQQQAEAAVEAPKNLKAGQDFLDKNKSQPGVVTLPDGLQYKILKAGTGPKPTKSDVFVANYKGTFIDGKQFDASPAGEPLKLPVGQVVQGWQEALQIMPTGSKWQLFIPSALAYGERGYPPTIPPNATLIFEMELLSIDAPPSPPTPPMPK